MSLLLFGLLFALSAAVEAAGEITFIDFMIWKAIAVVVLAGVLGLFGVIDEPPTRGGSDKRPE